MPEMSSAQSDHKSAFVHVDSWVFDLDNTLYPASSSLFPQIHVRMTDYVSRTLSLNYEDARTLQRKYYFDHGTTLNGMMLHHDVDPHDYLNYVHDIDHSVLDPNPDLKSAIQQLPGEKYIFTNGSVKHAEDTLKALGLAGLFNDMFDVVLAEFDPKPEAIAFDRFYKHTGLNPQSAAMFEDLHHNLKVPHNTGMVTVLVTDDVHPDSDEHPDVLNHAQDHVHFATHDLAGFLAPLGTS